MVSPRVSAFYHVIYHFEVVARERAKNDLYKEKHEQLKLEGVVSDSHGSSLTTPSLTQLSDR